MDERVRKRVAQVLVCAGFALGSMMSSALTAQSDDEIFTFVEFEQLEYRMLDGADLFAWDAQGWIGTDQNKLAFKAEGERVFKEKTENAEVQFLYRRMISSFFDAQLGVRHDFKPNPSRTYAVLGVQGLAPYFFEVDANAFVNDLGDVSFRLETQYELLLTQRLIIQPLAELNVAFSDDKATGVGSGFSDIELGLRLRYEIEREVAPYVGLHWERKFGETADIAGEEGEPIDAISFVAGIRAWF